MASNQDIKKVYRKEGENLEKRRCRREKIITTDLSGGYD